MGRPSFIGAASYLKHVPRANGPSSLTTDTDHCFSGFRSSSLAGIGNTGGDAYDTFDLATCVTLRPGEKYHRRPRIEGWKVRRALLME
jgi:hypothetical protein